MAGGGAYRVTVIAGEYRGRRLHYPSDPGLRPTMQRTKSSIFESLKDRIRGAVFIDLFSGAGAMGIEALSRGARMVHFVESNRTCVEYIRRNLGDCQVARERFRIHASQVERVLRQGVFTDVAAHIVHVDPPYGGTDFGVLLELLGRIGYAEAAVVVLEHPRQMVLDEHLAVTKTRRFGQTAVSFFDAARLA